MDSCIRQNCHGLVGCDNALLSGRSQIQTSDHMGRETNSLTSTQPDEEIINPNGYLSIVSSLNYLAVATRPDLTFAVGFLSRFAKSPTSRHWSAIQHVLD
ncbi:copia-type pol polyprotein-like [Puccinia sorghi]|uniref:Copia-type pol polyprotein-like n=1 Tax=Puccinia sorghi TaxID=27349 RepID=A0A0L6VSS9_9BASI|nr:copia-type pol polyprotein-like [Puccinia sorghi]